ncbi:MAG: pyridoxal-phosphate dependent enzyme [Gammaproteobacteria bacterium]|nr:pyridoxal-phosphate dependent enzyme [Gammaproteobacteria bacterium]
MTGPNPALCFPALNLPSPLEDFDFPPWRRHGVPIWVKRDDSIHPTLSGNKWRKLKYNLLAAREQGISRLASFGGPWSNHLHALAYAGRRFGFETLGLVRGEAHEALTPCLRDCRDWGMRLERLPRAEYRRRQDPDFQAELARRFGPCLVLPEGGSNALALRGVAELVAEIDRPFDLIACAVGSGATLAGIASALPPGAQALGLAVLKGAEYLEAEVRGLLAGAGLAAGPWSMEHGHHGGGYARVGPELLSFCAEVEASTRLVLEPVYTGKLFQGIGRMLEQGQIATGTRLVLVHTGGLQGLRGFKQPAK